MNSSPFLSLFLSLSLSLSLSLVNFNLTAVPVNKQGHERESRKQIIYNILLSTNKLARESTVDSDRSSSAMAIFPNRTSSRHYDKLVNFSELGRYKGTTMIREIKYLNIDIAIFSSFSSATAILR